MAHSLHQIKNKVARMKKHYPMVVTGGLDWMIETIEQSQTKNDSLRWENHALRKFNKSLTSEIRNLRGKTRFKVYEENLRLVIENAALKGELDQYKGAGNPYEK
jgi:regulator of replication initiation timing